MTDDFYSKKPPVGGDKDNPMREPRFSEIATFMRAPLAESLDNVDIGLIGVPTDLGVTNRAGARHGPREIRNSSSLMRTFNLGMNVIGFDPMMTVNNAWELQPGIESSDNLSAVLKKADVVTIHIPSTNETRSFIGKEELSMMKDSATLINLSRAEIVDDNAIKSSLTENRIKTYVTDFPDRSLIGRPNVLLLPHLGASTKEAETKCAQMVSRSIRSFLENGNIYNSVNFPEVHLDRKSGSRLSVTNQNQPNMVGQFTTCLGEAGININDLSHKNFKEIGYTLIDIDKLITSEIIKKISQIDGVISIKNLN